MQIELFIDGKRADLSKDTVISETKQINDFFEIKDRQTSYTNTFKIPKTENNKAILQGHGIVGLTSLWAYRTHRITVYRDGLPTINNGIGYVKNTDDNYNIYVYSDNIDLFEKIKDKNISDLKLNSLNHELNIDNWLSTFDLSKPYVYAVADYGYTEGNRIVVDYQIPSLKVSYIWNKIFSDNGFKWKYVGRSGRKDYSPFESEQWDKLAFTLDSGLKKPKGEINSEHKLTINANKDVHISNIANIPFTGQTITVNQNEGTVTEYVRTTSITDPDNLNVINSFGASYVKTRIRIKEDGFYRISISGTMFNTISENLAMTIEVNGNDIQEIDDGFEEGESSFGEEFKSYFRQGDEIFIRIDSAADDGEIFYAYEITLDMWLDNTVNYVNFSAYFTKIKQKDFIKDIVNFFGLIYRRTGDVYEFISIEELLNPLAGYSAGQLSENDVVEDWSDKFDSLIDDQTQVGDYARKNIFKYQYVNEGDTYADSHIDIDDETIDSEKTLVTRIFNAPDRSLTSIQFNALRYCPLYEEQKEDDGTIKEVKDKKTAPFFFNIKPTQLIMAYKLFGATNSSAFAGDVPLMGFDNLDWNYALPQRYSAFSNMITYGRKFTTNMMLTSFDIANIDFFKLKYVKQLAGVFYLNKIKNFSSGRLTKVELIKVKTIEYKGEFSDDFNNDFNI